MISKYVTVVSENKSGHSKCSFYKELEKKLQKKWEDKRSKKYDTQFIAVEFFAIWDFVSTNIKHLIPNTNSKGKIAKNLARYLKIACHAIQAIGATPLSQFLFYFDIQ